MFHDSIHSGTYKKWSYGNIYNANVASVEERPFAILTKVKQFSKDFISSIVLILLSKGDELLSDGSTLTSRTHGFCLSSTMMSKP